VNGLDGNTVKAALRKFGLTEKETQIYIFLAKQGVQGAREIAKRTTTANAVAYRILKILQRKGFVESTLESPVRYTAVPFENILESNIKAKQEEAGQIEAAKNDLLTDWSKISKGKPESPVEKFMVIEGTSKIFNKIRQMITQTKNEFSAIATVPGLVRADRFGIFEEIHNRTSRSVVQFRYITDLSKSDLKSIRFLKKRLRSSIDLRGRNPELGMEAFPRMVVRDKEEVLFFITPNTYQTSFNQDGSCLCTNCKSIVQAFSMVFEEFWQRSTSIEQK